MGIFFGLVSAFCWGSADLFARSATRRIGTFATLLTIQFIGFIVLGGVLVASGELAHYLTTAAPLAWALALLTGALNMISQMALYRSFEVCRTMALVSPIAATYAAITVVLAIIAGESLTASRGFGILLALLGVMFAATSLRGGMNVRLPGEGPLGGGVGWALMASVSYGLTFYLLGFQVAPTFGYLLPVWIIRAVSIMLLLVVAFLSRRNLSRPDRSTTSMLLLVGILDTAAYVATAFGVNTDQVSVVTVLGSLFTAVTVVLSWIFLHERLQPNQWLGVGLIITSIVLVSV